MEIAILSFFFKGKRGKNLNKASDLIEMTAEVAIL